ncbi:hypothetical protein [Chryseobacterium indoltheticum]|uniref:Uncharacterized protein n=1 Tax=Chryseobacterium indoltheticum TaxID=254 RepID=A0A381F519_9FLAO|nr:hypothetical protein [Chryseobacterium indoltheticum]AZA74795.1 hypothetical protein EG358_13925 [Chryseobacterium indoltheticum]SIQ35066.1 hypothetical protein SAMN05421682_104180 [Chryseobacterium indoltheticum]SUX41232.1 Uncharacterised protein [Chryseobacterium indoltheticum]
MAKSQLTGSQIKDGTITRDDINITTTGKAVVAKLIDGNNGIKIDTQTGIDSGTGDVSLKIDLNYLDTKYPSLLSPKSQNLFFASPAVGSGNPTFRALVAGDIPNHTHTFASLASKPTTLAGYGVTDAVSYGDTLMPSNAFGGKKLFINSIDNAMYAADKKWDVQVTLHMKIHNSESYPKVNPDWVEQYSLSTTDNKTFTITNNVAKPPQVVVYSGTTLCTDVSSNPVGALQFTYNATTGTIVFGAVATSVQVYPEYNTPKDLDSPVVQTLNAALPFNGSYENGVTAGSEHYMKVRITPKATSRTAFNQLIAYPYGSIYLSYYYNLTPDKSELRVYNRNFQSHGVGWKKLNFADYIGNNGLTANVQSATDEGNYGRSIMEVIIYGHNNHNTQLSQIDWKLTRQDLSSTGSTVTKFGVNKLYYDLKFGDADTDKVVISPLGNITSEKFVKTGGTAVQFLKADGSIDSNSYLTQSSLNTQLAGYATLNGVQTFTNTITFNQSPLIPWGTLAYHAVNLGQLADYVDNSTNDIFTYVSANYMGKNQIASTTVLGGVKVGANLTIDGTGILSATNTNTTYTAGNGLTLTGTVFSLPITVNGSGNYITDVTQNANGITVTKGTLPTYVTQASLTTQLATKINALDNAVGIGFIGGSPDSPYIRNSIGFDSNLATTSWTSSNFVTFFSNQIITGIKTYTASPKVPFASQPDDAVPFGQAEEIAQARVNDTFAEVIYKNSANDLTFDFDDFPNVRFATITCKGNNFQNIRVENMPRGATLRILNGSASLSPIIYFDGGSNVTSLGSATWVEFYRDQDSDIFKNNVNGTNII